MDELAAVEFLIANDATTGKVGITGFCYGGGVANAAAVAYPELASAVLFYGRHAPVEKVPDIKAALLLHYAENDANINGGWPAYEAALKEHGKTYGPQCVQFLSRSDRCRSSWADCRLRNPGHCSAIHQR